MGNKNSSYNAYNAIEELESAKYDDLNDPFLNLKKYIGCGDNIEQSLEDLTRICKKYGIPEPEKYGSVYHCGTINVVNSFREKKRLNPVFFKERNERYFAIVFYPKI